MNEQVALILGIFLLVAQCNFEEHEEKMHRIKTECERELERRK